MSRPATSCSRRYTDSASTYCSRKRDVTIASRNERVPRFSVYQLGRGSEPVIVVGSISPAVAFSIRVSPTVDTTFRQYYEKAGIRKQESGSGSGPALNPSSGRHRDF